MSDALPDEKQVVEVSIGSDHLKLLEAVAEAASDLKLAKRDSNFAELNGGLEKLERILFDRTSSWEFFASMMEEE
jgi:hypothetical protein